MITSYRTTASTSSLSAEAPMRPRRSAFAKGGWTGFLRLLVSENAQLKDSNNNWVFAKAYLDLGEKDKAFEQLNKAYEQRLSSLCWLKVEPQLDPIRDDPRYKELVDKIGFPK